MKEIRTEDAVGHILCHDITQIIKDVKKGVLFKKGHIVREEDIPLLLSVGKEHLYVWEKKEGILHENEGAEILYKICAGDSDTMHGSDIKEGKNAGAFSVGVIVGSSELGLSQEEFEALSWQEQQEKCKKTAQRFLDAGADKVVYTLEELAEFLGA